MISAEEFFDWRGALIQHRKRLGLSRPDLAWTTGISASAIKSYECGTRHPSLSALDRLIAGLGLARDMANPIRAGAGYAVDWSTLFQGRFRAEPEWLFRTAEECPWPVLITGQGLNVVYVNRPLQRIWDLDLSTQYPDRGERNLLAQASSERFVKYVENYDELMAFMLGLAKGDPRLRQDLENPAPWLREAIQRFLGGDPQYVKGLMEAWETSEPLPHRTRFQYRVKWLYRGERRLRFFCTITIADLWGELSWNDWIPEDAETWTILNELTRDKDSGVH